MTKSTDPDTAAKIRAELPRPRTVPLDAAALAALPYRERFLAEQLLAGQDVYVAAITGTRVDVGSWLGRGRVWVFALADSLAFVACGSCGPRARADRIPYGQLGESQYNHVTGELALAPVKDLPFRGLKMDPADGYQILAQIYRKD